MFGSRHRRPRTHLNRSPCPACRRSAGTRQVAADFARTAFRAGQSDRQSEL